MTLTGGLNAIILDDLRLSTREFDSMMDCDHSRSCMGATCFERIQQKLACQNLVDRLNSFFFRKQQSSSRFFSKLIK